MDHDSHVTDWEIWRELVRLTDRCRSQSFGGTSPNFTPLRTAESGSGITGCLPSGQEITTHRSQESSQRQNPTASPTGGISEHGGEPA